MRPGPCALLLVLVACSRTPPEPAPPSSEGLASRAAAEPKPAEPKPAEPKPADSSPTSTAGSASGARAAPPSPSASPAPSRCITPLAAVAKPLPKPASDAECPKDPEGGSNMPTATVAFPDAPGSPRVDVEIAANGHDIEKGLMYRRHMNEEHGMLFRLGEKRDHTFWMHNTCIPLDMLFVDDDGVIVGIVEGAEPLTDTTRSVGCLSTYVLEMNAGWCRRHAVKPGQKLGIPAVAR